MRNLINLCLVLAAKTFGCKFYSNFFKPNPYLGVIGVVMLRQTNAMLTGIWPGDGKISARSCLRFVVKVSIL